MLKKFLFILCFLLFFPVQLFGAGRAVEDIFLDIGPEYPYLQELQTLYDRGMIYPDASREFNPDKLLNRDEFVGISMEVICTRCIQPHTDYSFIDKYVNEDVYFDISPENRYFYCVAEADDKNYVRGYDVSHTCENGTEKFGERPFCPLNTITLEEAVAVLLRNSGIYTIEDNAEVLQRIQNGEITQTLGNDIAPTDEQGRPYTFYGYFQKGLDYVITEYDADGNEGVLRLIEPDADGNIYPKKRISKEEFLKMSYIALKSNSCQEVVDNGLALKMLIWEKTCSDGQDDCVLSDLQDPDDTYDFEPEVEGFCDLGIDETYGYMWRFYNVETGENMTEYSRYLNDYQLPSPGEWRIYLRVTDKCGNSSEVYSTIFVTDPSIPQQILALNVDIIANPIYGYEDLLVDFEGVVTGGTKPYSYNWDFGDGQTGIGKIIPHLFTDDGLYYVTLNVLDANKTPGSASVVIMVLDSQLCEQDSDDDGVVDCEDICPLLPGESRNLGCPVFETSCSVSCGCEPGYVCSDSDPNTCSQGVCVPETFNKETCLYNPSSTTIFGNAVCRSCPCQTQFDFLASVRKCDIIFPAITSPDAKRIYSRGKNWLITQ